MRASSLARPLVGRISQPAASTSRPVAIPSRGMVTIPHPSLSGDGQTQFVIKLFDHLPSTVHALAVLRAAEARLGPIVKVDVPKDAGTKRMTNLLFVSVLKPVAFDKSVLLEIPAPVLSRESTQLGGPGLADVVAALHTPATPTEGKKASAEGALQFRIEARGAGRAPPARWARQFGANVTPTDAERAEDDRIVRALASFGGFYGGFDGVADKFKALEIAPTQVAVVEGAEEWTELEQEDEVVPVAPRRKAKRAPAVQAQPEPEAAPRPVRKSHAERLKEQAEARSSRARTKALEVARRELLLEAEAAAAAPVEEAPVEAAAVAAESTAPSAPSAPAPPREERAPEEKGSWGGWLRRRRK
ncbi:hypothetical protein Q8F55_007520 [Vanrija albida]|uniref:Ribosomal protein L9 domain-containing protein n=1 Tax=Vanrija albida TaxID=181172 RepID=A0ABR3PTZ7_9TREE